MGGEFPRVNGAQQQGLVRFSKDPSTNISPANSTVETPTVRSTGAGEVLVSWRSSWDRDNENLTYDVVRNNNFASPVATRVVSSAEWDRPYQAFLDTGVGPLRPIGWSCANRTATRSGRARDRLVASTGAADAYAKSVADDGPQDYWRFSEPSGSTVADYTNRDSGTLTGSPVRGVAGAIPGDSATRFDGTSSQKMYSSNEEYGPFRYTVEAWFNTTTNRGARSSASAPLSPVRAAAVGPTTPCTWTTTADQLRQLPELEEVLTSAGGLNNGSGTTPSVW